MIVNCDQSGCKKEEVDDLCRHFAVVSDPLLLLLFRFYYFFEVEVEVRKMQWFGEEQFLQLASSAKDTKQTGTKIMRKTSRRSAASRRILFAIIRIHQQSKLLSSC